MTQKNPAAVLLKLNSFLQFYPLIERPPCGNIPKPLFRLFIFYYYRVTVLSAKRNKIILWIKIKLADACFPLHFSFSNPLVLFSPPKIFASSQQTVQWSTQHYKQTQHHDTPEYMDKTAWVKLCYITVQISKMSFITL